MRVLFLCLLLMPFANRLAVAAEPTIEFRSSASGKPVDEVRLKAIPAGELNKQATNADSIGRWSAVFRIYTVTDGVVARAPVLGDYEQGNDFVIFRPRYPFQPGVTYRGVFEPKGQEIIAIVDLKGVSRDYTVPRPEKAEATRLEAIYPTATTVPENLLKFYLHFSRPMSRGEAYRRIRLLKDDDGSVVEYPFLELGEELWSPDGRRFTLYFDPGRIKRGLKPRELFGPSLIEGGKYTLVVDSNWPDADGEPLAAKTAKSFRVVAPDDGQPDPKRWKVIPPAAGSQGDLVVDFDEPLDSAMLERVLIVFDSKGQEIEGTIAIERNEKRWTFRPLEVWKAGKYELRIAATLEDLAGNSIGRPFEVDVFRPMPAPGPSDTYKLSFEVKGQ